MKRMLTAAAIVILLYAGVAAAAYFLQDRMLFPAPPARGELPVGGARLRLQTPDGIRLVGVRLGAARAGAPVVLAFGGNGWNAEDAADYLHGLYPEAEVVAFHYRGYPPSGGRPRTRDLEADSLVIFDAVAAEARSRRIVAVGFSIGSGVAAHVAAHGPVAGAILVTPFDSLTAVAARQLPWLPVRLLFRNPMEPARELAHGRVPIAIIAGAEDSLVRPERTEALRKAAPNLVYDRTIPRVGHNDIYASPAFHAAMLQAMGRILEPPPAR